MSCSWRVHDKHEIEDEDIQKISGFLFNLKFGFLYCNLNHSALKKIYRHPVRLSRVIARWAMLFFSIYYRTKLLFYICRVSANVMTTLRLGSAWTRKKYFAIVPLLKIQAHKKHVTWWQHLFLYVILGISFNSKRQSCGLLWNKKWSKCAHIHVGNFLNLF